MTTEAFHQDILKGIPSVVPAKKVYETSINHAPKRKDILSPDEKKLALKNALRYFPKEQHEELIEDFLLNWKRMVEFTCCDTDLNTQCMLVLSANIPEIQCRQRRSC